MSLIHEIPGFSMMSDEISRAFTSELREAVAQNQLPPFIKKWAAVWKIENAHKPEHVRSCDAQILSGDLAGAEECLRSSFEGNPCSHAEKELCVGMEVRIPWALMVASVVAEKYGVPQGTALHQLFCEGPHDDCF